MERRFLETEPVPRLFARLAFPAVVGQLVTLVYNMVDRMYIGHIPEIGSTALTGIGVCMPATMVLAAFSQLAGVGGAPRASFYLGQGNQKSAEKVLGSCTTFLLGVCLVLMAVGFFLATPILRLLGGSPETLPYARDYFQIYILGTVFAGISTGLIYFINAQGSTTVSMCSVSLGAGLNILLDPLFIFVFHMGVRGAALATILSQAVSAVWVMAFLCGKKSTIRLHKSELAIDWRMLFSALALGISPFTMQITESLVSVCFNRSLLRYGGDIAVGAMTIFATLMQIAFLPLHGLAQGAQPITSFNYGAGHPDRVAKSFRVLLASSVAYSVTLWGLFLLFPTFFAGLFADSRELLAFTGEKMKIYFAMLWVIGVQIACQNTFLALGNAKISLFLALLRKIILLVPLIFLLPAVLPFAPVDCVLLAEPVADFLASATTLTMFLTQNRQLLRQK